MASLVSQAMHFHNMGYYGRDDSTYMDLNLLIYKASLMLDLTKPDDGRLDNRIRDMVAALEHTDRDEFLTAHEDVMNLSRTVLRRESQAARQPIGLS